MSLLLPAAEIRQAIAQGDFDAAHALLVDHETRLRAALEGDASVDAGDRQPWLDLLAAQRDLIDELRTARDDAGRALDRMGRDRRGMAAYLGNTE